MTVDVVHEDGLCRITLNRPEKLNALNDDVRVALKEAFSDLEERSDVRVVLLAIPPGPLAMTRAMTSAIGRTSPAMVAGWGDADHQQWSFTEDEYREAARRYVAGTVRRPKAEGADGDGD